MRGFQSAVGRSRVLLINSLQRLPLLFPGRVAVPVFPLVERGAVSCKSTCGQDRYAPNLSGRRHAELCRHEFANAVERDPGTGRPSSLNRLRCREH